jgi:hypothetical protein
VPTFQGRRVSAQWLIVLTAAQRAGVNFRLNSGQRTFSEQAALYALYQSGSGNLAAVPSHNAPHIRTGRPDHALDVDMYAGDGVQGLARWLRRQGASVAWTVPGEGWHIETPRGDLERLAKQLDDPLAGYTASEARWIRELDRLQRAKRDPGRRRVLRRVMTAQRKRLWRAAQGPGGWDAHRRRDRYASLKARTT